ncbi:monooxygenase [Dietzia natronolimnaea]|uniref:Monooxygenase n=1 Tax=Dietzia natronolimnaea TaxID=161920 RepID=A0A2A2WL98_9ACTN|nr:FAD-dependent monooxygenase [Dietzia natronolimnaea]PAY21970.1 monooxygenase [Dietzia natronolimnaea]
MSSETRAPVVISGAGSSGATLALLLAARGIPTLVLDRRQDPLTHPAAHVINARSLEIWREIAPDLAGQIAALSPPISEISVIRWMSSTTAPPLGEIDLLSDPERLDQVRSLSDFLISHVGQHLLMPVLWKWLDDEPLVDFRRGVSVRDITRVEDGVVADTDLGRIEAQYVVGADGANSPIRESLGIGLRGPVLARMASAFFRSPDLHPDDRPLLTWIYRPEFAGVLIAHADRHYVLMGTYLHPGQAIAADPDRYWRDTLPGVLGEGNTYDIVSTGAWTMTSQTAESFRRGRVILVGDAAHRFPHTGGYGLNSGVQDAHNLAWKLDAVLTHGADETLLDTYELERRPVVERFADHSVTNHFQLDAVTRHFGATNRALYRATRLMGRAPLRWLPMGLAARVSEQLVRGGLARTAVLSKETPRAARARAKAAEAIPLQLSHFVSTGLEFGYCYDGPLVSDHERGSGSGAGGRVVEDVAEYAPCVVPGGRLPHVSLVDTSDGRQSILQLVERSPQTVTLFTADARSWQGHLDSGSTGPVEVEVVDVGTRCVDPKRAEALLCLERGGAVAVRCDGHIIWSSESPAASSAGDLVAFLEARWAPVFGASTASSPREKESQL